MEPVGRLTVVAGVLEERVVKNRQKRFWIAPGLRGTLMHFRSRKS